MPQADQISAINNAVDIINDSLPAILPELILSGGFVLLLILDLISSISIKALRWVSIMICAAAAYFCIERLFLPSSVHFFDGIAVTPLTGLWQLVFLVAIVLTSWLDLTIPSEVERREKSALILSIGLGAFLMVIARNYLVMVVGIELVSLSSYVLVAINGQKQGYEAGIKYLLFGAVATAIMLYGISLVYGINGSLVFREFPTGNPTFIILSILILSGVLFKLGAAPMHIWAPDVYQATPASTIALFSVVPKLAAIGLIINWLQQTMLWQQTLMLYFLGAVAILSIVVGVFSAIWQQSIKRLMAYSTIANAGFMLLGIVAGNTLGLAAIVFFGVVYALMNYLTFTLIGGWEQRGFSIMSNISGRAKDGYYTLVLLVIGMIALTGLPPTAGFTGKLLLFSSLWAAMDQPLIQTVFSVAVLSTVVSLFFYLKLPYYMIFKPSVDRHSGTENDPLSNSHLWLATFLALPLLWFFIKSDFLLNFIQLHIFAP